MDAGSEFARAKWLLFAAVVFLVSGCVSWGELVYLIAGREAQADVTKSYEVTRRGRLGFGGRTRLTIDYSFTEKDGIRRQGTDTVSPDWPISADGKVPVQYTAGAEGRSRLAGNVNWIALAAFGISLGAIGIFGFKLWREATNESGRRKTK